MRAETTPTQTLCAARPMCIGSGIIRSVRNSRFSADQVRMIGTHRYHPPIEKYISGPQSLIDILNVSRETRRETSRMSLTIHSNLDSLLFDHVQAGKNLRLLLYAVLLLLYTSRGSENTIIGHPPISEHAGHHIIIIIYNKRVDRESRNCLVKK
jgi:hypothetical protein